MTRPLVAVVGRRAEQVAILRFSATLAAEALCEAVWAAGGEPVVLHGPAGDPAMELPDRLDRFDGVLMPGGADVDPIRYGAQADPRTQDTVLFQDDYDLAVSRAVIDLGLPMLAICRGMQILNVAAGGTLCQHISETTTPHHNAIHDVRVLRESRLHLIVGSDHIDVSSYHHQAIDRLGADLVVTAMAGDGVVEAVEHCRADIIAVQWHPEDRHGGCATDTALFADLIDRAGKRKDSS
ncbi:gamma-glutamyl-gamma-aminobutyrate hydrolase family protein [Mycolicibacterium sarraceniae]|uniref:Gamma-glutamyl-gamma-aminobutyrate hydrolase n=1 Tax=Mycolicibacterium sarraceniae TaxID=1534348 RepID=A0A7I7SKJ1_9MYCO|nr:gamma-glutamyl-gamma-aminobutyrate hydrolase family protein [Mycolicibacterium sarraceniae]BBY57258.1 gamma-glutamyl-gamma-aminobutyrate hydrolase [Mycolicibacterium sarraceniae]